MFELRFPSLLAFAVGISPFPRCPRVSEGVSNHAFPKMVFRPVKRDVCRLPFPPRSPSKEIDPSLIRASQLVSHAAVSQAANQSASRPIRPSGSQPGGRRAGLWAGNRPAGQKAGRQPASQPVCKLRRLRRRRPWGGWAPSRVDGSTNRIK